MTATRWLISLMILSALCLVSPSVSAQAPRTFVASTGADANACSRVAPCRTLQAAINAVTPGGEVVALDAAGFGSNVTIGKSLSIIAAPGVHAGIMVFAGDGITVNAGANGIVTLHGLTVNGQGGSSGIVFNTGAELHIENCVVNGFSSGDAIFQTASGRLIIKDTIAKDNSRGVDLEVASGNGFAALDNVTLTGNNGGLVVFGLNSGTTKAAIIRSSISDNIQVGIGVVGNGGTANLDIESCLITNNGLIGLEAGGINGGSGAASISNCLISHNSQNGFVVQSGGTILSRGNNTIIGNGTNIGSLTPLTAQ